MNFRLSLTQNPPEPPCPPWTPPEFSILPLVEPLCHLLYFRTKEAVVRNQNRWMSVHCVFGEMHEKSFDVVVNNYISKILLRCSSFEKFEQNFHPTVIQQFDRNKAASPSLASLAFHMNSFQLQVLVVFLHIDQLSVAATALAGTTTKNLQISSWLPRH